MNRRSGWPKSYADTSYKPKEYYLYRWWDADGNLIYIGSTCRLVKRWREHQIDAWYDRRLGLAARIAVRPLGMISQQEARAIEKESAAEQMPIGQTSFRL